MSYINVHFSKINEIFQRRNIVVHNGGVVNSIYMSKVAPELRENISINDRINVTQNYLDESINLFESNFILIAAELWKKLLPEDDNRSSLLNEIALEHIVAERWIIGENLSYFLMNDKGLPEISQLIGKMNYWQSKKWQGKYDEIKDEIENFDLSAKDLRFLLAWYALTEKKEQFFKLLPQVMKNEIITYDSLKNWPIFRGMRKKPNFYLFAKQIKKSSRSGRNK